MSTPTVVSSSIASSSASNESSCTTMANNTKSKLSCSHSSSSADRIRSRFLHKIGIDSPQLNHSGRSCGSFSNRAPIHAPLHGNDDLFPSSGVSECILRLEPLKIALESDDDDDDSSLCSHDGSYTDDVNQNFALSPDDAMHIDYFHKKPHQECSKSDQEATTVSLDRPLQDYSGHSLPSLVGSDGSDESFSVTTPPLGCSCYSNKRPKLSDKPRRKKKSVSIHKSVSVVTIPSRLEYSNNIREKIWTTAAEIQKNAARNTVEFCSESWKWQNVLEDEQMFVHQENGELVHPIHVHNALSHIQSSDLENNEEIQMNLSLISALAPPAAAAVSSQRAKMK